MSKDKGDRPRKIVEMFAEGKRFTEDVLEENKRLRLALEGQKNRTRELEVATQSELPSLRKRVRLLEEENLLFREELRDIKRQYNEIERENWDFSERYLHVERQNTTLLNLYVASQRLHSTLSFAEVIQIVKELVVNLVGSESFDICLYNEGSERLKVLAALGTDSKVGDEIAAGSWMRSALACEIASIAPTMEPPAGDQPLVACVPLKLDGKVLGAIIIRRLLSQKAGIEGIDHDLFELLGEHAISAVCCSYLFSKSGIQEEHGKWHQVVEEMGDEASHLEDLDVEPKVLW